MPKKQTPEQFAQEQKQARTVKVATLVKAAVIVIAVAASFVGGWTARSYDNARVTGEANALVEQLSKSASKE